MLLIYNKDQRGLLHSSKTAVKQVFGRIICSKRFHGYQELFHYSQIISRSESQSGEYINACCTEVTFIILFVVEVL